MTVVETQGNADGHVVLRGGNTRPNYDAASIAEAAEMLRKAGLPDGIMVDCSHANSGKQHARQEDVWKNLISQRVEGSHSMLGVMLESHLIEGSQPVKPSLDQLKYGVSITDACLGWDVTARMMRDAAIRLRREQHVQVQVAS